MPTRREQVRARAVEVLRGSPQGVRYSQLVQAIHETFTEIPVNTIESAIWNLDTELPGEVYKADRGLFRHTFFRGRDIAIEEGTRTSSQARINEEDFYRPFADYLVNELEECTKAIGLGGHRFGDRWGTPDVIGIKKPKASDIIKPEAEIVTAEIKTDTSQLITAFGQACAYNLFSHRVYLVIPKDSDLEDKSRIESLCLVFGLGLIFFDNSNAENPQFEIRVRPLKHEPDSFYINKYMRMVEGELFT